MVKKIAFSLLTAIRFLSRLTKNKESSLVENETKIFSFFGIYVLVCRVLGDILSGISHSSTEWLFGAGFVLSDKPSGTQALSECRRV